MEEQNIVKVRMLAENFDFIQITGGNASLERPIVIADTSRPGLELAGYFENSQQKRLVILGDKEIAYIATMSVYKQRKSFDFITNEQTPAIIVTRGHKRLDVLKRYAKRKNFPISLFSPPIHRLIVDTVAFLDEQLATGMYIHGGLLSIYGKGVPIRGEGGMEKSETALELIKRGHLPAADDRVDCYRIHNKTVGKALELLREILEIRGIGVINISRMFGVSSVLPKAEINFQANLEPWKADQDYDRVGTEEKKHKNILGIDIPKIAVPACEGRSMVVIIEFAVTNYMLSVMGMDSVKEFEQRVLDYTEKNKNEQQEVFMTILPDMKTALMIGSLQVTWYAVLILSGAFLTYFLSLCQFKKWGYKEEVFENFLLMMLPIVITGARLYYAIFEWNNLYAADPIRVFYTWEGGLAIHGGMTAGTIFGWFYFRRYQYNGLCITDVVFPNVMLAQAIGCWGDFINQGTYGGVVSASFYDHFPAFIRDYMYIDGALRQPTFLYESIGNLVGSVLITVAHKEHGRKKRGDLAFAYLAWYGTICSSVEGVRTDSLMLGGFCVAQLISSLGALIGILGILGVWDKVFKNIYPFKRHKPAAIFDLDGILVDTKELIYKSFEHTFAQYKPGYTLSEEEKQSFLGPTLKQSFLRYFKEEQVDKIIACYHAYSHEHHDEFVKPIPHVRETLEYLKANDYPLAVMSNKLQDIVRMGLRQFDLEPYFETILGGVDVERPEPDLIDILTAYEQLHVPHDDVVYVGDAPTDIEACKKMGALSVALVYEESRAQEMQLCKPCVTTRDMSDLITIIKEDYEWSDVTT